MMKERVYLHRADSYGVSTVMVFLILPKRTGIDHREAERWYDSLEATIGGQLDGVPIFPVLHEHRSIETSVKCDT